MKPRLFNVLLPMLALAATAIPSDPAKAEGVACPRAATTTAAPQKEKAVKVKAVAEKPRKEWRLEAI